MIEKGHVVITGASSGVGRASVGLLSEKGFKVIACVRKEKDAEDLKREFGNIDSVLLELQDQSSIEKAAKTLGKITDKEGLKGIVNCAGTIFSGPLESIPRRQWFEQYDVNLFGTMAVTQAMLPMIRKGQGRIINIGAVGGGLSLPFFGAIASSKIAFQAVNDCLRRELHPWGIRVIIIEPGGIDTPANDKMLESVKAHLNEVNEISKKRYGKSMESFTKWAYKKHQTNLKPNQVAKVVFKAFKSKYPKTRYRLGWDSRSAALAKWILPDKIFDRIILWISSFPIRFGAWKSDDN